MEEDERARPRPPRIRANPLSSLRYRDNRVFWFGTTLSSIGQAAFLVSSSWFAFHLGGSGAVGLVTFATMVPLFLATLLGGLLADRMDRRKLVLGTEATQACIALVIGVLAIRGAVALPGLVALVFASGVARAIEQPTVQTVLPSLVPRGELLNIFALNNMANRGSRFAGPVLIASLLATRGAGPAYLVIAALYVLAFSQVLRVPMVRQAPLGPIGLVDQIKEGGRYIREQGVIALLLGITVLHCLLTMAFDATLPLFASQSLHGDGAIYSSLVSAMGLGSIIAALVLAAMHSRRQRGVMLFIGGIGSGLATATMAVMMNNLLALTSIFMIGATTTFFMTITNTMMQEAVPDQLRGRISGIFLMSASGVMSFGNLGMGYLAARVGAPLALGPPALLFIVLLLVISALRPVLRHLYRDGILPGAGKAMAAGAHGDG
jgi:MFS family permease